MICNVIIATVRAQPYWILILNVLDKQKEILLLYFKFMLLYECLCIFVLKHLDDIVMCDYAGVYRIK